MLLSRITGKRKAWVKGNKLMCIWPFSFLPSWYWRARSRWWLILLLQTFFSVELGQEFELKKGQRAGVAGTGFKLAILNFFNQPCPPGMKCIRPGIGIEFEYRYNGQSKRGINPVKAFGYRTDLIRSDYEAYADLRIIEDKGEWKEVISHLIFKGVFLRDWVMNAMLSCPILMSDTKG